MGLSSFIQQRLFKQSKPGEDKSLNRKERRLMSQIDSTRSLQPFASAVVSGRTLDKNAVALANEWRKNYKPILRGLWLTYKRNMAGREFWKEHKDKSEPIDLRETK